MLCCVSRKASGRPNHRGQRKHEKPADSPDRSASSSGFSESSSASSGDFASSGFSAATSSSSSSTSGFSSAAPPSLGAFANSTSDSSSSSGSGFCDRFDVPPDYLVDRSGATPEFDVRGVAAVSSNSSSAKGSPPVPPKRLLTFSPSASALKRSNAGNGGDSLVENEKSAEDEPPVLLPCAICARTFMPQSLEKHTRICERSAVKKRKPFDSAKQRIQGTDLAEFLPKETTRRKVHQEQEKPIAPAATSKGTWKQTHDEFLRAVRAARGENVESPPQRQNVVPSSHVTVGVPTRPNEKGMCPTCNRQFSIKAYERHVAWCKEHATRVPISPATNVAKERLEARMRYRAPLLKNRRLTNREKYSPGSAMNLPSYAGKNSPATSRPKESASTPSCNNKGGNEAGTPGSGAQSHQKASTNAGRSGQGREGMSTRPMKSRLSDRSSRPPAEIESGPPTNPPSTCPVPPPINLYQHSRLLLTTAAVIGTSTSPLSTSRSVNKSEDSRTTSHDFGNHRRICGSDRRGIELNISDGATKHQRQNIVSARSRGHPKVNDVAINDDVIGMTVQRCGLRGKNEKQAEGGLVTWKQISEDHNLIKQSQLLTLNDDDNLEQSVRSLKIAESKPVVENELNCSLKSGFDWRTFATSGVKKLNQTYLLRESLDPDKDLSGILSSRMRGPVVNRPRIESFQTKSSLENRHFRDFHCDTTSPRRFNAEVNVTSSPLQTRREDKERCEDNFCRAMSPRLSGRAKLAPLNLETIHNDVNTDQVDTSRSNMSAVSSLQTGDRTLMKRTPKLKPISGRKFTYDNLLNLRMFEEGNFERSKDIKHSFDGFEDCHLKADSVEYNQLLDSSRPAGGTVMEKDDEEENAGNKHHDESIENVEVETDTEENKQSFDAARSPKENSTSTVTSSKESFESLKNKILNVHFAEGTVIACDKRASESSNKDNYLTLIDNRRSFEDVNSDINGCEIVESLDTPRLVRSDITTMNSCPKSSPKETSELLDETELSRHKSSNNSYSEENDKYLDNRCDVRENTVEKPKNYQRCGTYVIDRAPNVNRSSKHPASDEFVDDKPLLKRRRTEENVSKDLKPDSPANSAEELEPKITKIDGNVDEIHEKYVNRNFDYNSDNGDNNLFKDIDTEASVRTEEKLSSTEISNYDLPPKAFSDSVVPLRTSSSLPSPEKEKERVVQDPTKIRRKLKKKMSLLRSSTDTLISSVEASNKAINKKSSSVVASQEFEKTPQVEQETIRQLNFTTIEKTAAPKTSCCGFLPEIPIDRIATRNADANGKKFVRLDSTNFWSKARKNSCTRLINLDPPKCHETRVRNMRPNVGSLPPVVPAAFRKERRRGSFKDYDPFLLAERQMNELLSDTCSDQSYTDSPSNRRRSSSPPTTNYPLSHSSAFVKYPDPLTRNHPDKRASLIAPPSEFDDLTGDFSSDSTETNSISREMLADLEDTRARENGFAHESKANDHVLGRRVIIDKSKALGTSEMIQDSGHKNNSQSNEKARKILDKITPKVVRPHVTRSSSVRANSAPKVPERKSNNNSSVTSTNKINSRSSPGSGLNNRNNNYTSLSGSNMSLSSIVSSEVEVKRSNSLFDELASSFEDDASGTFPSLRSLLKNDSLSVSSPVQSNRPRNGQISDEELSSPDSYQRQDHNKLSADSAYSSLNRKYSNHGRSTNDMAGRLEGDSPQRRRDGDAGSTCSAKSKMSKFCHECGCKFPEVAKFCCECGIRRLAL